MNLKTLILMPVYKDWQNLDKLNNKINLIFSKKLNMKFDLIIIDDFSNEIINFNNFKLPSINYLRIIKLHKNVGSQRAIAIGLKFINKFYKRKYQVIIIDSDGQDNPNGIVEMIFKSKLNNNCSVVSKRGQRKEVLWFKVLYEIYNILIKFFSFKDIRYGNYSLISYNDVNRILLDPNLWNAFPPTLSINLKNLIEITMNRKKRFSGDSKMNFYGLIYHAMRVFSVLRFRILLSSTFYMLVLTFYKVYELIPLLFFFILTFLILFNLSNFYLNLFCKKNFLINFEKIKVLNFICNRIY